MTYISSFFAAGTPLNKTMVSEMTKFRNDLAAAACAARLCQMDM
jgi:hypothetical protein